MSEIQPETWLKTHFPVCKALDHDWTMERYDFPQEVRDWIKENWVKVSDANGGTYHEPEYYRERQASKNTTSEKEFGKKFAQKYKKTDWYQKMDSPNKEALNVMASQGTEAAIKHMFTHPETGRPLTYSEMRSFYG